MAGVNLPQVKYDLIRLSGGMDQVTPTLSLNPGVARDAVNFECSITGGYTRIAGYERYDGRPNPSDARYLVLTINITGTIAVGNTITGGTSLASAKVILINGSTVVCTKVVGAFVASEQILVSAVHQGTLTALGGAVSADARTLAEYLALAANEYRADIGAVPGSGPIRGVAYYKDVVYAWRNNSAGTQLLMYRSGPSGWALVTTPTLLPDGRVETVIANFGGGVASTKLYGCDGQNKAFEFDGTTYTQITTGMAVDKPEHIAFHKQHLFLSFGSSVQFSALGNPLSWTPVLGAGEIALIDVVTGFMTQPGDQSTGALAIYSDDNTFILYGTSSENFNLVSYNVGTGAKANSAQNIGQTYVFDDRGVINMQTTLNYGNFDSSAVTMTIRPFVQQRRNLLTCSGVNREKGQYRVFFSDGYGLYLTFVNGQMMGAMPVQFPNAATCMCEGEKPDGSETAFFGSSNGFVYRLDAGTSFDGQEISANMVLVFNATGSPRVLKRYRKASLEITGTSYAEFAFSYDLGYGSTEYEQGAQRSYESNLTASFWDTAVWDAFVWDGRTLAPSEVEVEGTAENISVRIASISSIYESFTINSVILHYSFRRGLR